MSCAGMRWARLSCWSVSIWADYELIWSDLIWAEMIDELSWAELIFMDMRWDDLRWAEMRSNWLIYAKLSLAYSWGWAVLSCAELICLDWIWAILICSALLWSGLVWAKLIWSDLIWSELNEIGWFLPSLVAEMRWADPNLDKLRVGEEMEWNWMIRAELSAEMWWD
jgi:hypothetical protein